MHARVALLRRWLGCLLGCAVLVGVASPAMAATAGRTELTGTYVAVHADALPDASEQSGHVHHYEHWLHTGGSYVRLHLPPAGPRVRSGVQVRVVGTTRDDGSVDVVSMTSRSARASAAAAPVTGTRSVLVILAHWSAPDTQTPQSLGDAVLTRDAAWFREASYGAMDLTGTVTPWLRIAAPSGCDYYGISGRAEAAATAVGYTPGDYAHVMVYFPWSSACGWGGLGQVGGRLTWLNGYVAASTHELGHNLGLWHSNSATCTSGVTKVPLSSSCTVREYGDVFDEMGGDGHFNAVQKAQLGWLGGRTVTVSGSATVALAPYEVAAALPAAAQVTVGARPYWFEYRQRVGADSSSVPAPGGVLVHVGEPASSSVRGPRLLDMTPDSPAGHRDAFLPVGSSWHDPERSFTVTVVSAAADRVDLAFAVTVGTPPSAPALALPVAAAYLRGADVPLTWRPGRDDVGVREHEVWVDGALVGRTGGTAGSYVLPRPAAGSHRWSVVAVDTSGNRTESTLRTFLVDDVAPSAAAPLAPAADGQLSTAAAVLRWQPGTDGVGVAVQELVVDGVVRAKLPAGTATATVPGVRAGRHTWSVTTGDRAGNRTVGATSSFVAVAPVAPALTSPAHAAIVDAAALPLAWTPGSDAQGVVEQQLLVDGRLGQRLGPGVGTATVGGVADGRHSWQVVAVVDGGRRIPGPVRSVTVDTRAPALTDPAARLARGAATAGDQVPVDLSWSVADLTGVCGQSVSRQEDAAAPATTVVTTGARAWRTTARAGVATTVAVQARDCAGHATASPAASLRAGYAAGGSADVTPSGTWSAAADDGRSSDAAGASVRYGFTGRQVALAAPRGPQYGSARVLVDGRAVATVSLWSRTAAGPALVWTWSAPAAGPHTVQVVVVGTAGHPRVTVEGFATLA